MKNLYFAFLLMTILLVPNYTSATNNSASHSETNKFVPVDITFTVNLANMAVSEEGVYFGGSFNDWGNMPMTNNGNGNWTITLAFEPGTELEYKFKNGLDAWEDDIIGECVLENGNRTLIIPDEAKSVDAVSFNSCFLQDVVSSIDLVEKNQLKITPNPFSSQTLVTWNNSASEIFHVRLLNITGQLIRSYNPIGGTSLTIAKTDLLSGLYFLNFRNEEGDGGTLKLVVE